MGQKNLKFMAQFLSIRYPLTIFLIISDGLDIQAGALLTMLRETRLGLEGQHSVLEHSIRQTQRHSEPKLKIPFRNSVQQFKILHTPHGICKSHYNNHEFYPLHRDGK